MSFTLRKEKTISLRQTQKDCIIKSVSFMFRDWSGVYWSTCICWAELAQGTHVLSDGTQSHDFWRNSTCLLLLGRLVGSWRSLAGGNAETKSRIWVIVSWRFKKGSGGDLRWSTNISLGTALLRQSASWNSQTLRSWSHWEWIPFSIPASPPFNEAG